MAKRKRASAASVEGVGQEGAGAEMKRSRTAARCVTYGRVDPTYGQRSAIPGLDDWEDFEDWEGERAEGGGEEGEGGGGGDEDEAQKEKGGDGEGEGGEWEGDDEYDGGRVDLEALRYLRSVREEASGIPTVLVAPRVLDADVGEEGVDRGVYDDGVGDSRGWYEDGAYTAAPMDPEDEEDAALSGETGGVRDAQRVYYEALMGRFETLRKQLSQVPPRHAVEQLDADHGCHMSGSAKDYELWRWRIANTDPKAAQLANMDKGTALRILNVVGDPRRGFLSTQKLLGDGAEQTRNRISAWTWGLLAKLPDRGEMVSEEVGVVRELGKRAVWVDVELKGVVDMESLKEHVEDEGEAEDEEGDIVDVEIEEQNTALDLEEDDAGSANEEEESLRAQRSDSSSPVPQFPSSISNHKNSPFIGPISPESVRGGNSHVERLTRNGINREKVKDGDKEQHNENGEEEEEEALAQARANLLARLNAHHNDTLESAPTNSTPPAPAPAAVEHTAADDIPNSNPDPAPAPAPNNRSEDSEDQPAAAASRFRPSSSSHLQTYTEPDCNNGDGDGDGSYSADAAQKYEPRQQEHGHENENGHEDGNEYEYKRISPTAAVKTLLDMIITVAGEGYGQRDLLEFRERWS